MNDALRWVSNWAGPSVTSLNIRLGSVFGVFFITLYNVVYKVERLLDNNNKQGHVVVWYVTRAKKR